MPVKNGKQYIEAIDRSKPDLWLNGRKIEEKLSEHKAFRGLMASQAALYEMQHEEEWRDRLTYASPTTGDPVGLSFLQPRTKADLKRRRIMMQSWASRHHGLLGRSPDYMNTMLMVFYAASGLFGEQGSEFTDNIRTYYEYCRERDITLSHAFVQPKIARTSFSFDSPDNCAAARIVDRNQEGLIVHGAFLMATQGATAEELLVFPAPYPAVFDEENPYVFSFAVPNNLPGIRFVCRESLVAGDSAYDYPLSSRYEEMDNMVIFNHVLVPWDRVFFYGKEHIADRFFQESHFYPHLTHQILCRQIVKTEFLLGTVLALGDSLEISGDSRFREQAAEIMGVLETLKAFLVASEHGASKDRWGSMLPDPAPLYAANAFYPKLYPRIIDIIRLVGASGLMMIPGEADFQSPELRGELNRYLRSQDLDADRQIQLFRLAWELAAGSFGGRHLLYEMFFFGNEQRLASRLYEHYGKNKKRCVEHIGQILGW